MKNTRQRKILNIITEKEIETQHQLMVELDKAGFHCTQATVSRDIKDLRLVKELSPDGVYRYTVPIGTEEQVEKLRSIFKECVISYVCAQNIVVLRTLPGLAAAAASAVDSMDKKDLAGTLAGDDTVFIAMTDNESAQRLCEEFGEYF